MGFVRNNCFAHLLLTTKDGNMRVISSSHLASPLIGRVWFIYNQVFNEFVSFLSLRARVLLCSAPALIIFLK